MLKRSKSKNRGSILIKYIRKRIKKDKDAIIVVAGERGSTKSGCAITLGYILDRSREGEPRFFLRNDLIPENFVLKKDEFLPRIVFKPSDFLKLVSGTPKLPKGSVIVWDEIGVEGDARDFQTKKNKLLKRTMETIRSRNYIIILTAPTLQSYDVGFRRSNTIYMEARGVAKSPSGKVAGKVKIYKAQTNPRTGKVYYKNLRFRVRNDPFRNVIKNFYIGKPPVNYESTYKRYKELFLKDLYASYVDELNTSDFDSAGEKKENLLLFRANKALKEYWRYFDKTKGKFVSATLQAGLNLKPTQARELKQLLDFKVTNGEFVPEFD